MYETSHNQTDRMRRGDLAVRTTATELGIDVHEASTLPHQPAAADTISDHLYAHPPSPKDSSGVT